MQSILKNEPSQPSGTAQHIPRRAEKASIPNEIGVSYTGKPKANLKCGIVKRGNGKRGMIVCSDIGGKEPTSSWRLIIRGENWGNAYLRWRNSFLKGISTGSTRET